MEVILWLFAAIGAYTLIRQNTMRGLTTVRAGMFLLCLEQGDTVEEANKAALYLDSKTLDPVLIHAAKNRCKFDYNGKQLEMIAAARMAGFKG